MQWLSIHEDSTSFLLSHDAHLSINKHVDWYYNITERSIWEKNLRLTIVEKLELTQGHHAESKKKSWSRASKALQWRSLWYHVPLWSHESNFLRLSSSSFTCTISVIAWLSEGLVHSTTSLPATPRTDCKGSVSAARITTAFASAHYSTLTPSFTTSTPQSLFVPLCRGLVLHRMPHLIIQQGKINVVRKQRGSVLLR